LKVSKRVMQLVIEHMARVEHIFLEDERVASEQLRYLLHAQTKPTKLRSMSIHGRTTDVYSAKLVELLMATQDLADVKLHGTFTPLGPTEKLRALKHLHLVGHFELKPRDFGAVLANNLTLETLGN
jgi:hypothetical protein